LQLSPHAVLTASFAVAVFFVVLVAVRKLWAKIDTAYSSRQIGLACAGGAVIGYVLFDWVMQQQGWVLGSRVSVMVPVMRAGLTGAGLFGGAVLGWFQGGSPG
jgi:hypothetical protein